jgi:hypothetical protein
MDVQDLRLRRFAPAACLDANAPALVFRCHVTQALRRPLASLKRVRCRALLLLTAHLLTAFSRSIRRRPRLGRGGSCSVRVPPSALQHRCRDNKSPVACLYQRGEDDVSLLSSAHVTSLGGMRVARSLSSRRGGAASRNIGSPSFVLLGRREHSKHRNISATMVVVGGVSEQDAN